MSKSMRAKFRVTKVEVLGTAMERLHFNAVAKSDGPYPADGSDENNTFAKWSPSAACTIDVANPALHGQFAVGQQFYVDFTPADTEPPLTPFLG